MLSESPWHQMAQAGDIAAAEERVFAVELALKELESLNIRFPEGYLRGLREDWSRSG